MALETLKGIEKIGGFKVLNLEESKKNPIFIKEDGQFDWGKYDEYRKEYPISISDEINTISFKIQNGPVKENGVNGCQVDTIIEAAKIIIEGLNKNFPCRENSLAITKLDEALMWLRERTRNRIERGVEGSSKE